VTLRDQFADGVEQVERADDVVHLGEDGVAPVDHGVRRRPLLGEVYERLGPETFQELVHIALVGQVADGYPGLAPGELLPPSHTVFQARDPG